MTNGNNSYFNTDNFYDSTIRSYVCGERGGCQCNYTYINLKKCIFLCKKSSHKNNSNIKMSSSMNPKLNK